MAHQQRQHQQQEQEQEQQQEQLVQNAFTGIHHHRLEPNCEQGEVL